MDSIAPPKLGLDPPAPLIPRESEQQPEIAAALTPIEKPQETREPAGPAHLLVRMDAEAGRFVQTMTDSTTQETLWRYPSEAQLAYSRAVSAYLRALSGQ